MSSKSKYASTSEKKRKFTAEDEDFGASTVKKKSRPTQGKKSSGGDDSTGGTSNLFDINLAGEADESVEILDSCDELRRKINAYLRTQGVTKTSMLRDMAKAAFPNQAITIQSKQLTDFLTKKGATAGSTSRVCYASYVFFEKKRLAEGKPKNKHRIEMEKKWKGKGGLPRKANARYWCRQGEVPVEGKLGDVIFVRE